MIELTMQIRDKNGLPTGKTRTISSERGDVIHDFWMKHKHKKKQQKNKLKKNEKLPTAQEAKKILWSLHNYSEAIITKRTKEN